MNSALFYRPVLPMILIALVASCGPQSGAEVAPDLDPHDPHHLYPLSEGNVWSYNVDTGTDLPILDIKRVTTTIGTRVEVVNSGGDALVYEIRDEGIWRPATETWLLRRPIVEGQEWPSSRGRVARVSTTTEVVELDAGRFEDCVRIEESGAESESTIQTVYCPRVGPVFIESELQLDLAADPVRVTAELLGFDVAPPEAP